jgi:hypothetical protein
MQCSYTLVLSKKRFFYILCRYQSNFLVIFHLLCVVLSFNLVFSSLNYLENQIIFIGIYLKNLSFQLILKEVHKRLKISIEILASDLQDINLFKKYPKEL